MDANAILEHIRDNAETLLPSTLSPSLLAGMVQLAHRDAANTAAAAAAVATPKVYSAFTGLSDEGQRLWWELRCSERLRMMELGASIRVSPSDTAGQPAVHWLGYDALEGENLGSIASRFGLSPEVVFSINKDFIPGLPKTARGRANFVCPAGTAVALEPDFPSDALQAAVHAGRADPALLHQPSSWWPPAQGLPGGAPATPVCQQLAAQTIPLQSPPPGLQPAVLPGVQPGMLSGAALFGAQPGMQPPQGMPGQAPLLQPPQLSQPLPLPGTLPGVQPPAQPGIQPSALFGAAQPGAQPSMQPPQSQAGQALPQPGGPSQDVLSELLRAQTQEYGKLQQELQRLQQAEAQRLAVAQAEAQRLAESQRQALVAATDAAAAYSLQNPASFSLLPGQLIPGLGGGMGYSTPGPGGGGTAQGSTCFNMPAGSSSSAEFQQQGDALLKAVRDLRGGTADKLIGESGASYNPLCPASLSNPDAQSMHSRMCAMERNGLQHDYKTVKTTADYYGRASERVLNNPAIPDGAARAIALLHSQRAQQTEQIGMMTNFGGIGEELFIKEIMFKHTLSSKDPHMQAVEEVGERLFKEERKRKIASLGLGPGDAASRPRVLTSAAQGFLPIGANAFPIADRHCHWCHAKGHMQADCPDKAAGRPSASGNTPNWPTRPTGQ
jgi:hypothetical protein